MPSTGNKPLILQGDDPHLMWLLFMDCEMIPGDNSSPCSGVDEKIFGTRPASSDRACKTILVPVVVPGPRQGQHVFGVALKQQTQDNSSEESLEQDPCYDPQPNSQGCQQQFSRTHWDPPEYSRVFQSAQSGRNRCDLQADPRGFQSQHSSRNFHDPQIDPRGLQSEQSNRNLCDLQSQRDSLESNHSDIEQQHCHSLGSFKGVQPGQDRDGFLQSRLHTESPFKQSEVPDGRRSMSMHSHFPNLPFPAQCYSQLRSRPRRPPQHGQRPIGISSFKSASSTSLPSPAAANQAYPGVGIKRPNPFNHEKEDNNIADKRQRFQRTAEALRKSGLMEITMQSAKLLRQNKALQTEIDELKLDTIKFLRSIMNNPENQNLQQERKQ